MYLLMFTDFQVQYLKTKRKPKDFDWRKAAETNIAVEKDYEEDIGMFAMHFINLLRKY